MTMDCNLGRARFAWRGSPGGNWHANVDLSAWSLDDHHVIDLTEAWMEWRPVPQSAWRSNLKIGAFYRAHLAGESRARLDQSLHHQQFRAQHLGGRGAAHHRRGL